jgi:hypothetical protein
MSEQKFWFIASSPVWPDDGVFEFEGDEGVDSSMPVFYSTREKAEAEQRDWNEAEWEDFPFGEVEESAEQSTREEPSESPNFELFAMEAWLLAEHLRSSDISRVKLDDEVLSVEDFLTDFFD